MKRCGCDDWKRNIGKIHAPYMLNLSAIGQYDGKVFSFCPWCGMSINEERWEDGWIDVNEKLPFEEYNNTEFDVMSEVLVTVQTKDCDPNDDPEVMLLWFNTKNKQFSIEINGESYDKENLDWYVTHWKKKPKPAQRKERND